MQLNTFPEILSTIYLENKYLHFDLTFTCCCCEPPALGRGRWKHCSGAGPGTTLVLAMDHIRKRLGSRTAQGGLENTFLCNLMSAKVNSEGFPRQS